MCPWIHLVATADARFRILRGFAIVTDEYCFSLTVQTKNGLQGKT
jgi:hypothetical protein